MPNINVDFALSKTKGAEERVTLSHGATTIVLDFDSKGKARVVLVEGELYFVRWYFLGSDGDKMSVAYSYVDSKGVLQTGELIKLFTLDGRYARPYPGGLWIDDGTTAFLS